MNAEFSPGALHLRGIHRHRISADPSETLEWLLTSPIFQSVALCCWNPGPSRGLTAQLWAIHAGISCLAVLGWQPVRRGCQNTVKRHFEAFDTP